jgi:hypothetical protein
MKKIYFFDIDNTLLDHRTNAIPPSALAAIERLKLAGDTIVVATGRSYGHAKPFIDQVSPHYAITANGACILKEEREVLTIPLARQPLIDLFNWVHAQGHCFGANGGGSAFLSDVAPCAVHALGSVNMPFQTSDRFYLQRDVYQGWLFFDESLDASLMPSILERYPDFGLVRWHKTAVDIKPAAINKWTGCQWIMAQTGFQAHQAIAFGDGLNDIEMLQGVGLGIAMANGHAQLRAIAKRIAPALHLDGIAATLDELAQERSSGRARAMPDVT